MTVAPFVNVEKDVGCVLEPLPNVGEVAQAPRPVTRVQRFASSRREMLLHVFSSCLSEMMVLQHERINLRAPIHRLGANLDGTDVRVVHEQCCQQSDERVSSITVNLRQAIH